VKVLPITDRTHGRCEELVQLLQQKGFRAEADLRNEKIGYKIREAQMQKIPYMLVIGDKEAESGSLSIRTRSGEQLTMTVDEFLAKIEKEVVDKSI
jgi:threonyl-tRNA synthetase